MAACWVRNRKLGSFLMEHGKKLGIHTTSYSSEKRGKFGVQTVGAMSCDPQRFSDEYSGLFSKAGILPKRKLTRYFVTPNAAIKVGGQG